MAPAGRGVAPIGGGSLPRGPRGTGSRPYWGRLPASWAVPPIRGGSLPRGPRGTGSLAYWGRLPASWPPRDGESPLLGEAPCLVGTAGRGVPPIRGGSLPRGPRGTGSRPYWGRLPASWPPRDGESPLLGEAPCLVGTAGRGVPPIRGGSLPRGPRGTGSRPYWGRLPASWAPRDGESPQLGDAPCLVAPAGRGVAVPFLASSVHGALPHHLSFLSRGTGSLPRWVVSRDRRPPASWAPAGRVVSRDGKLPASWAPAGRVVSRDGRLPASWAPAGRVVSRDGRLPASWAPAGRVVSRDGRLPASWAPAGRVVSRDGRLPASWAPAGRVVSRDGRLQASWGPTGACS